MPPDELRVRVVCDICCSDLFDRNRERADLVAAILSRRKRLMDQTDVWMLGVGLFGVVFYLFALYFQNQENGKPIDDEKG